MTEFVQQVDFKKIQKSLKPLTFTIWYVVCGICKLMLVYSIITC